MGAEKTGIRALRRRIGRRGVEDMAMDGGDIAQAEWNRLREDNERVRNWERWGSYLSERQWGTVREDYSPDGSCWEYLPHDHARSRAYRWGEDGILGLCDRECRLCFALALWNGHDPILKERLFGLTNHEGNHGEDVKELYYYLDATPTHSYMRGLYRYPQQAFPYAQLVRENRRRGKDQPEYEIGDTGVFHDGRYFDVYAEYAKASDNDILIRVTLCNRAGRQASLHLLPTLWFRNTWVWGCRHEEDCPSKPALESRDAGTLLADHETLGTFLFAFGPDPSGHQPRVLFTENETNVQRLFHVPNATPCVKDAFHRYVVEGDKAAVSNTMEGTKAAPHYRLKIPARGQVQLKMRLYAQNEATSEPLAGNFDEVFRQRVAEADAFYHQVIPESLSPQARAVARQAYAGLLWTKQFYHYVVADWLDGDPKMPPPPPQRRDRRNSAWRDSFNRDVLPMPDKWEYPWYAGWDTAFHLVCFARIDPEYAKRKLLLFLREWYMHPSGQLPACEFEFSDVNPPVHAWACWRVYKMTAPRGRRDRDFLASAFQKLLMNFTWWVNRKDPLGKNIFSGGFLGLDNIGLFDRSQPLPSGEYLRQADATAWMAFYSGTMLSIALELAGGEKAYEDMASKFFEHFVSIAGAINTLGGTGLWDETDGFFYDQIQCDSQIWPLKVRSLVGLLPLIAVEVIEEKTIDQLPGFKKRMQWFLRNRRDLAPFITYMESRTCQGAEQHYLLAIPSRDRLTRVLRYLLDENEFLSPFGIRSLSRFHQDHPFSIWMGGVEHQVEYWPGLSRGHIFGGNSNWRGPIWFPVNYLLIEALQRYDHYYGPSLQVEFPTGSGNLKTLDQVALELSRRLTRLFVPDESGRCPNQQVEAGSQGAPSPAPTADPQSAIPNPPSETPTLFHEYFHAETGEGLGASHQTGWTALIVRCLEDVARTGGTP
jgi:hypothetical protein